MAGLAQASSGKGGSKAQPICWSDQEEPTMVDILEKWQVMPHDALTAVDDGILSVAGEIDLPLGAFPRRMTVVGLRGGRSAIYSVIALDEPEMARIEALGQPAFLIVPRDGHRMDAKIWTARYPDIAVISPLGSSAGVADVVGVFASDVILVVPVVDFFTVRGTCGLVSG